MRHFDVSRLPAHQGEFVEMAFTVQDVLAGSRHQDVHGDTGCLFLAGPVGGARLDRCEVLECPDAT